MPTPLFLVTEYKNVRRKSPANYYTQGGEQLDLWKVGMIHGYYAGMGLNFYFPTEPEASRFTLYTIYRPEEIIEAMDNEKFASEKIAKWKYMSPPNRYTDSRALLDNWKVSFSGERNDFLETIHPWESTARAYKVGRPYTMQDILGTLPATPRDTVALLEAYAEQLRRIAEDKELARIRREAEEFVPGPPSPFAPISIPVSPFAPIPVKTLEQILADAAYWQEQLAWMQLPQDERTAILREQYLQEREAYLATFTTSKEKYLADIWDLHQGNQETMDALWAVYQYTQANPGGPSTPPVPPAPEPPVFPPPVDPVDPNAGVASRQAAAIPKWWRITGGGAAGWYASANYALYLQGVIKDTTTYGSLGPDASLAFSYFKNGELLTYNVLSFSGSIRYVVDSFGRSSDSTFDFFGFFVADASGAAGPGSIGQLYVSG